MRALTDYFEMDDIEMTFDGTTYTTDARDKTNGVIAVLKNCAGSSRSRRLFP